MDTLDPELEALLPHAERTRRGFVMTSLISGFALSVQPASTEAIHTDSVGLGAREVKIPVKDGSIPAYRAMPDKGGPFPTLLAIHEAWGVHEHIKDLCRRLAKAGYFAVAAELWARQGNAAEAKDIEETRKLMASVPTDQVMSDLDATEAYAKSTGKADTSKLAVTGFCWGGFATWMYAAHNSNLKAVVSWYGPTASSPSCRRQNPVDIAGQVKCPVLAFYGGQDQSVPQDTREKREAACKAAGKTCEVKVYADAPHGFNADYRPSYRPDDGKDGRAKMLAWFKEQGAA